MKTTCTRKKALLLRNELFVNGIKIVARFTISFIRVLFLFQRVPALVVTGGMTPCEG